MLHRMPADPLAMTGVWTERVTAEWKLRVTDAASAVAEARDFTAASDAAVVEACLAGDREAFDVIVERHRRQIYHLCLRFAGSHEDACDLAQETFIRAYRGLSRFKGAASLSTWLYRIAVNLCLNKAALKTLRSEPLDGREPIDSGAELPEEAVLREERAAQVRAAIARLPPRQRTALILRVYHELRHDEIARILGSSVGAAKANVFHALANLKKQLT